MTLLAGTLSRRGWAVRVYSMLRPTAFVEELQGNGIKWRARAEGSRIPWRFFD
ncbi:MAG: hypothetical protein LC126_02685 [Bryobacterales bacterium]|nr:hypothetical protein [Bryobacterales bacterium]